MSIGSKIHLLAKIFYMRLSYFFEKEPREISYLIDDYYDCLRAKTLLRLDYGSYHIITFPFIDKSNDYIEIYIKRLGPFYLLSDGCKTSKNGIILKKEVEAYGLSIGEDYEVYKVTHLTTFSNNLQKMIDFIERYPK